MILDTRTILGSAAADMDNTVLLDIVTCKQTKISKTNSRSLSAKTKTKTGPGNNKRTGKKRSHTFTRDNRTNNLPRTQPHTSRLPLTRVGLLGLRDTSLETHALHSWVIRERRRPRAAGALSGADTATYLVEGGASNGGTGELATGSGGEGEGGRGA